MAAVIGSQVVPSAVEVDQPDAGGPVTVAVLLEGTEAGVAGRADDDGRAARRRRRSSDSAPAWFGALPVRPRTRPA